MNIMEEIFQIRSLQHFC